MNKNVKKVLWFFTVIFLLMNVIAFFHAYKFTHFTEGLPAKTKNANQLSFMEKIGALFFGVKNPRSETKGFPNQPFETLTLQNNKNCGLEHSG